MRLAPLVALAVLSACTSDPMRSHPANADIQHEVARVVEAIRHETGTALYSDLRKLVAYDVFAVDKVAGLANDSNARLRSNAMWVLAQIRDNEQPAIMDRIDRTLRGALGDGDPTVRYEAAAGLAARGHWDVLPELIGGLESDDSGIRFRCHDQLLATTSRDFGYLVDGTVEEREIAIAKWRHWYMDWRVSRS